MRTEALVCALLLTGVLGSVEAGGQGPTSSRYFPSGTLDDIEAFFYGEALQRMGEVPLAPTESETREVYRFLWAPSFHAWAVVRLDRDGDHITVAATRLRRGTDGERWGEPEPRIQKSSRSLNGPSCRSSWRLRSSGR